MPLTSRRLLTTFRLMMLFGLFVWAAVVHSQTTSPTDGSTPLGLSPGSPAGSHELSGFESINPYNGNLNFHLPLIGVGGRGGATMNSTLSVDTKGWTVRHQETTDLQGNPVDVFTPVANPWVPKAGYSPGVLVARQSGIAPTQSCGITRYIYQQTLTRLTFTTSDRTEYEFRDTNSQGQPQTVANACGSGYNRGTVFVTADGTAATFISDSTINDKINSTGSSVIYPSGYLMLRDGTRYRIDSGAVSWMRDRNGNKLSFSTSGSVYTITDSLNRTVTITPADFVNTFSDQVTVKGFGGATRTISVSYSQLSSMLRSTNPRNEPAGRYQIQTYHQLFPELNNASSYTSWNPWVVASVTLPNNKQYQLKYNCFAELARVNLPTGGAIEYDYTSGSGATTDGDNYQIYRRVLERRLYPDGANLETYTTYDASGTPVLIDQRSANGTLLSREKHYYFSSAASSLFNATGISYPAKLDGREYKTEAYAADGVTLLRKTETNWVNRANVGWWWNPGDASEPPNDPRVTDTTSTLTDVTPNLVSKKTFGYDDSLPYNNQNDVKEYAFGNGSAGSLVRETTTSYITSSSYTGTSVHLRSLPSQVSVLDANGVERARTTYEYDNYASDSNHAALVNRSNISGFDSSFGTSYTTRGNATGTTNYLLTNGWVTGSISAYAQYDIAGNVVKAIDALGTATNFSFTDNYGSPDGSLSPSTPSELGSQSSYAMATSVTNAANQVSYLQYDFYLGRPVDAQDANGTIYTGYSDNDSLDRPTKVVRAFNYSLLKSQSTFSYDDTNRIVTVTSDKDAYGDNLLKGTTIYDGLGRTIETRTYVNSTDYIAVQAVPFSLEQDPDTYAWVAATKSTNPYSPQLSEQAVWTTTFTDALGRVTKVRTPDSAIDRTSYSGSTVTVTEQTGKARKSITDALGRMTQVYEDPSEVNPNGVNWSTTYAYDVLNNLTAITQGVQTRSFVYDSLKRLLSTTNPENGTISYQYDNNGNLLVKTDGRGTSAHPSMHVSYDVLNRPVRRWYNGSSSTTATTHNSPVLPSEVSATDEVKFFYDSVQNLPSGAPPNFSAGYAIGRVVAETYGTNSSAGDYFGYDALGRATLKIQQTGGVNYQTTASYGVNGSLQSETYPSVHAVSFSYDGAGRTSSFSGNLGDGTQRTYSSGIAYSSLGGMSKEQFGTDTAIYNKLFYNVRGQLSEIRESSTSGTDTSFNRGAIINHYSNNCWGMCGGSNSTSAMTDNNGNLKKQEVYIPNDEQVSSVTTWWQRYDYDNLNRLTQVTEISGSTSLWQQAYTIDRYGNRTIDYNNTSSSMPRPQFGVDTNTNRLTAPSGYTMSYDAVGNLTTDTYSGQGDRKYDAENRMTQAWANIQWQSYVYDASGQRIKRTANGVETWMVYGIGGGLLAEYPTGGTASSPQKEYGYRNGQLLITAEPTPSGSTNLALNKTATQSSTGWNALASRAVDGNSDGDWNHNSMSHTLLDAQAWWQVDLGSVQAVSGVEVWNRTDSFPERLTNFNVILLDGNQAVVSTVNVPGQGGTPTTVALSGMARYVKVQLVGTNYLALAEVKVLGGAAYNAAADFTAAQNSGLWSYGYRATGGAFTLDTSNANIFGTGTSSWAQTSLAWCCPSVNKNTTSATLTYQSPNHVVQPVDMLNLHPGPNGERAVVRWTAPAAGSYQITGRFEGLDNGSGTTSDASITHNGTSLFTSNINGYGAQASFSLTRTVAAGDTIEFTVGVGTNGTFNSDSTGLLATIIGGAGGTANINWLVTDQLGTPRMIFDKTGNFASVSRHDYLPYGDELFATAGSRTTTQGYTAAGYNPADKARQKYTAYEQDTETGLNFAEARYQSSSQGRFTTSDTFGGSVSDPQSLNRYAYVDNNPMNFSDPSGHLPSIHTTLEPLNDDDYDGTSWDDPTSTQTVLRDFGITSADVIGSTQMDYSPVEASAQPDPFFPNPGDFTRAYGTLDAGMLTGSSDSEPQDPSGDPTLQVRGQAGASLSSDDPLRFPGTNKQTLGSNSASWGWGYQVEEVGTVGGDASTWTVTRTITDRIFATLKDGSTLAPKATTSREEANYVYNPVGGNKVYSIDAPGINKGRVPAEILASAVTMRYVGNYTTHLTNGRQTVDFKWSVRININMATGRVNGQFRRYHVRL